MTNLFLFIAWCVLYVLCAGLGCIAAPTGLIYGLCILASLLFFVPPAILLHRAIKTGDQRTVKHIVRISVIWLIVTPMMIICNFLSVGASALAGTILYYLMIVATSPMICGQIWVLSIFLWACLLMAGLQFLRKKK